MRTQAEWENHYQLMTLAKALADFARLEPDGVDSFKKANPDYVPAVWWAKSNWLQERDLLLKTWQAGFPADRTLKLTTSRLFGIAHLLASAGFPLDMTDPSFTAQLLTDMFYNSEGHALVPQGRRFSAPDGTDITEEVRHKVESDPQVWPYQRAVLFLHIHPKQARICRQCKKPFVSASSNAQWCQYPIEAENSEDGLETTCVGVYRKQYKHENWGDNRASINEQRRKEYAAKKKRKAKRKHKQKRTR